MLPLELRHSEASRAVMLGRTRNPEYFASGFPGSALTRRPRNDEKLGAAADKSHDHAVHHPVRWHRLRHAAVRAGVRARGHAGADELRQPRPRRLRHGRRLCLRRAGQSIRLAVLRRAAAGVRRKRGDRRGAGALALSAPLHATAISTRCCSASASFSCRSRWSTTSWDRRGSSSSCRRLWKGRSISSASASAATG